MAFLLILEGALVDSTTTKGDTPLMVAVENGHTQMVHLLLTEGADVQMTRVDDGAFPLLLAVRAQNCDMTRMLIEVGHVNLDQRNDKDGSTPLLKATENDSFDVGRVLIEAKLSLCPGPGPS